MKNDQINEICEMYSNNEARILAAAEELGCKTDSWYIAAQHIAVKAEAYPAPGTIKVETLPGIIKL